MTNPRKQTWIYKGLEDNTIETYSEEGSSRKKIQCSQSSHKQGTFRKPIFRKCPLSEYCKGLQGFPKRNKVKQCRPKMQFRNFCDPQQKPEKGEQGSIPSTPIFSPGVVHPQTFQHILFTHRLLAHRLF